MASVRIIGIKESKLKLIDREVSCKSRSDAFYLYAIGDTHIGARNCSETHVRSLIKHIQKTPNALWVGGGDYCDCINPKDSKRFTFEGLPDWVLEGKADSVRKRLTDICKQERERFTEMVEPIADKCIGLIEGNHESSIKQHYNSAHHETMCDELGVDDLTDAAFVRLRFKSGGLARTITMFVCHGHGGGRAAGSEPNHLYRLAMDKRADIVMRGHSHTFHILCPIVELSIPASGSLPKECNQTTKRAGNWGCWVKSYAAGPATYDSRACFPARPLSTLEVVIKPLVHNFNDKSIPEILMREYVA
jgi:predicted phosphodiesterase